ncbi:M16 family metallopeptidase [Rubrivivax rivuli]|uniref:Insulinase family protein n=1 Tax=Rubrivivax rivuli TaxID=1862385 RepID=A0A437RLU1_9BURK|nr:pitrilysin family protein [Rubrivivax rivuli]RVU47535.1 insulinase family protein [Rubrivivax rivuli]
MQNTAPDTFLHTLPNGVRCLVLHQPWRQAVNLSVFVRAGSQHEARRFTGISHVVEHMAFKGTATRSCQQINLAAEALGAEVNAHTDKDHTAFHIDGMAADLPAFVALLAEIVQHSTFPEEELERERQVILHEYTEFDEDPVSMAFRLFDRACYGLHPAGQPVIGSRANLERFTRADLQAHVARLYTGPNVVVAVAGPVDAPAFARQVEAAFGAMPGGTPNTVEAPAWQGGVKLRRMAGSAQCQLVLGHGMPPLADAKHTAWVLAAALLGEGMSSPLLDEIRERRGLAYHVGCSADVGALAAQFVIDAATAPEQADELLQAVAVLLQRHAEKTDSVALARARKQLAVRALRTLEQPVRRLEAAVQDVYTFGRVRSTEEQLQALHDVTPAQVRRVFATMAMRPAAIGLAGSVTARAREQAEALFVAEGRAASTIGA